jgi:hypothetical protein
MQTISLFVSSPGDVREERQIVGSIVERVQARYWNFVRIEPVMWEKEPLRATAHFNEELRIAIFSSAFCGRVWARLCPHSSIVPMARALTRELNGKSKRQPMPSKNEETKTGKKPNRTS